MNPVKPKLSEQLRSTLRIKHYSYKHVIKKELGDINAIRARRPKRLPVVLTQEETKRLLPFLNDTKSLMVKLLYGSGLRLMECHRLRIKDIDFSA